MQMKNDDRPFHLQIIEILEQRIISKFYKPNEQFPTEVLLAEEFGVSRGTIRKALQILENQGLLVRKAGRGTFIKTSEQTSPSNQGEITANLIGIALPSQGDRLSAHILSGAEQALRETGYGLIYTNLENNICTEFDQLKRLKAQHIAGIILFPLAMEGEVEILQEQLSSTPTVLVDRELSEFCGCVVMSDHYQGAYHAVRHLLDLGHRRIACIIHPSYASSVTDRVRGYEQAMKDANLLPYAPVVLLDNGKHKLGSMPEYNLDELKWVDHMLSVNERPTAAFCINDSVAIGVMRLAISKGLRIPQDLSIIGFDNSDFCTFMPVPLTSVEQAEIEIGMRAAEILLQKIANNEMDMEDQRLLLPTRLVIRSSTGAPHA